MKNLSSDKGQRETKEIKGGREGGEQLKPNYLPLHMELLSSWKYLASHLSPIIQRKNGKEKKMLEQDLDNGSAGMLGVNILDR